MASNGFVCEIDLNLLLLSTLGNYECPSHYVYLSIEIFGKVHQTKPQHAYYPLVFNETIRAEKTFWSPSREDEVLDMLEDVPVVIELRRIDPCFYNGLLLAYFDGSAKDLLFTNYPRVPCSINGREVYLNRTVDFKGTTPRLRYSSFADIKRLGGKLEDDNLGNYNSSFNSRIDDGYYSPTQSVKDVSYKSASRPSGSFKRSLSPAPNDNVSAPYYTRQTVASAIRSRSPSPMGNRSGEYYDEKDFAATGDSGLGSDKVKEPFVVRKVPDSLITRNPKLHDSLPRDVGRRGRSRRRSSTTRNQESPTSYSTVASSRRFRSASPTKRFDIDEKLDSYRPSRLVPHLGLSYDYPHYCYSCTDRCYSPLLDYYSHRLSRLGRCTTSHYGCHSHCCY